MFLNTETARINRLILMGGNTGMTELQFFAAEIDEWKRSRKRKEQITGDAYYEGFHDILTRKRTIIGEDGKLQEVDNLPNNRLVDNQFALMPSTLGTPLMVSMATPGTQRGTPPP